MTTVLFRCEAGADIGYGHVMRCLALAQEWLRRGGRAVFALSELPPPLFARLRAAGVVVETMAAVAGSGEDAAETEVRAANWRADWVVVDGPMFGVAWDKFWPARRSLLRIDDNGLPRAFAAAMVLNQNMGAGAIDYPQRPENCGLLLGPEYALLRPEFGGVRSVERGNRILVTMGGSDPAGATESVVAALREPAAASLAADLIVGAGNRRKDCLVASLEGDAPRLAALADPGNLPARFAGARCAVSAGGTTVYELALLRTPMLLLCTAENQRRSCERLAAAGAVRYLGWHADISTTELAREIAAFAGDATQLAEYAANAGRLVDGLGVVRVVEAMLAEGGA